MRSAWLVVALGLTACASTVDTAKAPQIDSDPGELGQIYELRTGDAHLGMAKIFTEGADRYDHGAMDRVAVHVGFWVTNETFEPLRVQPGILNIASTYTDGGDNFDLAATPEDEPDLVVMPGERRRIDTYAYVPVHVSPHDIDAFHVRWAVRGERSGTTYVQRTPFLPIRTAAGRGCEFAPAIDTVFFGRGELPAVTSLETP